MQNTRQTDDKQVNALAKALQKDTRILKECTDVWSYYFKIKQEIVDTVIVPRYEIKNIYENHSN